MTKIENMREDSGLGRLLSECFAGGERLRRELRLSAEQAEELAAAYPADVRPMGGSWYEITFQGRLPMAIEFVPVLLGSDINAYSMARAFHEAYGVKTIVYGMFPASVCAGSRIIDYRVREHNDRVDKVLENVTEVAREFPDRKILVLGCGDNYLNAISANLPRYPENVIAPYVSLDMLETLIHKEKFYELCDRYGIDHPATVVYHKGMGHAFELPFDGLRGQARRVGHLLEASLPHPEEGLHPPDPGGGGRGHRPDLRAGYEDALILQDFIPGDDSFMRVVTNYSGADGKVRLMCVGHVLLEEHNGHAIGNHAVIITEPEPELCEKLRASWRPLALWASPTSTSSTTSGTASSRPLRSTAARAAATTTSPARGTTWPSTWWRMSSSTSPAP